jgi:hypothetical protein
MTIWAILSLSSAWMALVSLWCGRVRYPAFLNVDSTHWPHYHRAHCGWISLLVVPGMAAQGLATLALLSTIPAHPLTIVAALLTALSLGQTLLVSGPIHGKISLEQDHDLIQKLIRSNPIRTWAWAILVPVSLLGAILLPNNNVFETISKYMT